MSSPPPRNCTVAKILSPLLKQTKQPMTVTVSWQESYVRKMTYKPSKLGRTNLLSGL